MTRFMLLLASILLLSVAGWADEGEHPEDLTAEQLGTVHFPISCARSAQEPFTRGVALLHSFWYEEAGKAFAQAAKDDPRCAIAHWGVAMSLWHQLWNRPDSSTIGRGAAEVKKAKSSPAKDPRERDYIAAAGAFYSGSGRRRYEARATAYSQAMERVYRRFPEDHEAAAFYALSLIDSDRKKAAAILEPLFAAEPNHPGIAHYLIHTYDTPEMAEMGLPAARRYAKIAPAAPHAVHMPSHIFARLGLWQEDIDSNLASIAATEKAESMHMGGEGHQFHAMDFLVYAYLQTGREAEAERVVEKINAMPPMEDMYGLGDNPEISALVALEASYALEMHHWAKASSLALVQGAEPADNSTTYWARAIGAARGHKPAEARANVDEIEAIRKKLLEQKKPQFVVDEVDRERREATAWSDYAEGQEDSAINQLRALADKDRGTLEASDELPAREMLADMLLEMNRPEQALPEYETDLKKNPNRFDGLYGAARAAEMLGQRTQAKTYYTQLVKQCAGSTSDRPELSHARTALDGLTSGDMQEGKHSTSLATNQ
jgi:tetratricopeptide (TPR) repeat protein